MLNKSKEPIKSAIVSVCGQVYNLQDILPGKGITMPYKVTSDSHYNIEVVFKSGRKLKKIAGYVTNGSAFNDVLVVIDSDITINPSK